MKKVGTVYCPFKEKWAGKKYYQDVCPGLIIAAGKVYAVCTGCTILEYQVDFPGNIQGNSFPGASLSLRAALSSFPVEISTP